MLIGSFAFANGIPGQDDTFIGKITIKEAIGNQNFETTLVFNDLNSFNEFEALTIHALNSGLECTASVEVTVTISAVSTSVTMKTEGVSCKAIGEKIKGLKKAIKEVLSV